MAGLQFELDSNLNWIAISTGLEFQLDWNFNWIAISTGLQFELEDVFQRRIDFI